MAKKIVILGGVGNGSVIAGAIVDAQRRGDGQWEFAGFLNDRVRPGSLIESLPVLGALDDWRLQAELGCLFINTIYRIDGQAQRIARFESLAIPEGMMATFVHPLAYVAPDARLGPGTVVMPHASVSAAASVGGASLVMIGATILHNAVTGRYGHFAAHACVGAGAVIADGVHVGLNATVRENLAIGRFSALGMGSVLTKDMGEGEVWAGNPARFLRRAE
jgi:acetyltransferase EpsM